MPLNEDGSVSFESFEWDEEKCRANIDRHGIDFQDAIRIFDGPVLVERSDRKGGEAGYARSPVGRSTSRARPNASSNRMARKVGSTSHHRRPCRADVGLAW